MLKRRKQQFEIDYDKLAEAIVKAQEKADKETIKQAVIDAHEEMEKLKPKRHYSKEFLKFVIEPTLWIFVVIGGLTSICSIIYGVKYWKTFDFQSFDGFNSIITLFAIFSISLIFATFSGLSLKEIQKEDDIEFLSTMFSNLVSFVAMIVSIIAIVIALK